MFAFKNTRNTVLIAVFVLLVGLAGCPKPPKIVVPNVVGMAQAAAELAITDANLVVGTVTQQESPTVPAGQVISQAPPAASSVNPGTSIDLVVSLGTGGEGEGEGETVTVLLPGGVPLEMVWIPAGTFMMGRYPGEQDSDESEDPQHSVTLNGFWMGKYELTKAQWTAVMGTTPWSEQEYVLEDLDSPAVYISWNMIAGPGGFIETLNAANPGMNFRLPSEAQWEYACRGGTITCFYWGDDPSCSEIGNYAWYGVNANDAGQRYAHVVGQKLPNAFGLYDISGNVCEWCQDGYHNNYTGAPADGSTWESPTSSFRVLRGGGWYSSDCDCRSANRDYYYPDYAFHYDFGVRIVRTP